MAIRGCTILAYDRLKNANFNYTPCACVYVCVRVYTVTNKTRVKRKVTWIRIDRARIVNFSFAGEFNSHLLFEQRSS